MYFVIIFFSSESSLGPENQGTKSATEWVAMQTSQLWDIFGIKSSVIDVESASLLVLICSKSCLEKSHEFY